GGPVSSREAIMGRCLKLLIVDDQEELLSLFAAQFERRGFTVMIASNANDALEQADCVEFDFILSDIQMADRDGLWLLHRIKDRLPKIPFYLMSAAAERYLDIGIAMGAQAVINKP